MLGAQHAMAGRHGGDIAGVAGKAHFAAADRAGIAIGIGEMARLRAELGPQHVLHGADLVARIGLGQPLQIASG